MLVDDDDIFNILHADLIHQVVPNAKITEFICSKSALIFLTEAIHANTPLPDFLFIDIRMPEMDGVQLISEIRTRNKIVPIIVVSAFEKHLFMFGKDDINDYIVKPINMMKMAGAISKHIS